jgi:hypothetical protein
MGRASQELPRALDSGEGGSCIHHEMWVIFFVVLFGEGVARH